MDDPKIRMMQQLAAAASAQQGKMTGRTPKIVSGALSEDTLVLTLHDALTPAEKALAQRPEGADQVEEFHRQLFSTSSAAMREEIQRVTGQEVIELALEAVRHTGTVVHPFPSGALVQVYLLRQVTDGSPQADSPAIDAADDEGFDA